MKKKLFLFDLDNTIINIELLPYIASIGELKKKILILTKEATSGKTSFKKNFRSRVNMLKHLDLKETQKRIKKISLDPHFLDFLKDNCESSIIVTHNLDVWVEPIMKKYNLNYFSSTAKVVNDKLIGITSILNKNDIVKKFSNRYIIAIGDGMNDYEMLKNADMSFLYGGIPAPPKKLLKIVDYYSTNSEAICRILRQL